MRRILALALLLGLLLPALCREAAAQSGPGGASISYYTEIPGITKDEIDAIEALKAQRGEFSYGHLLETESFHLPDGSFAGFTVSACALFSDLFGVPFTLRLYEEWAPLKADIDGFSLDFTGIMTVTPERMRAYHMTSPIAGRTLKLYTIADAAPILSESDLNGLRVGTLSDTVMIQIISERYPELSFETVEIDGFAEAAAALRSGEIDAFVANGVSDPKFEPYPDIRSADFFPLVYINTAVTTANPELRPLISALNKYLAAGGNDVLFALYREGNYEYTKHKLFQSFTATERQYLDTLAMQGAKVTVGLQHDGYPFSFYNTVDKAYQGIALDVLAEITKLTGIAFDLVSTSTDTTIAQILERLKTGEVAMIAQLVYTESRKNDYLWSAVPYTSTRYALLSKAEYPDLKPYQVMYATVATVNRSAHEEMFKQWFPGHTHTISYATADEAFDALERGEVDLVMLAENMLLALTNYREKPGYKVNLSFAKTFDSTLGFYKGETRLRDIVDKTMPYIELGKISDRWTNKVFDYSVTLAQQRAWFATLFTAAVSLVFLITLFLFLRNRRLGKELLGRQAELREALAAAEEASRTKSSFLANMSHEIRTPMNGVIGFSELALGPNIPPPVKDDYLTKIRQSAEGLLEIINNILDVSKIESGKLMLENIPFELSEVFTLCHTIVLPKALEKGITLYCYAEPSVGKKLLGDPTRLRQALLNLLSNAVKFTHTGTVKLMAAMEAATENTVTMRFEVKDSGIGMTPEQMERVFEPFAQADDSTTRKYGGTGLGLSITKNIIEMMGGSLTARSEPGIGSKFSFSITFHTMDLPSEKAEIDIVIDEHVCPQFRGEVLLCEDNEINQQVIRDHLTRVGLDTVSAWNGKECVDLVAARMERGEPPFDLIFMDMHMPVMDGLEAAAALIRLGNQSPVVALTANVMLTDRKVYSAHGIPDLLGKPFTTKELWTCLFKYFSPLRYEMQEAQARSDEEEKRRRRLLTNFAKSNQTTFRDIRAALDEGDVRRAHRLAHTLAGLAGLIENPPLRDAARAVEQALTAGGADCPPAQLSALERELAAALAPLAPLLAAPKPSPPPLPVNREEMLSVFIKLESLLAADSAMSLKLVEELQKMNGTEILVEQIEEYEFESALKTLAKIKQSLEVF